MSGQQQRNNSGALFSNERRENDRQPTHTGSCTIDGKQFWISAWVKEKSGGGRYFSIEFKAKLARDLGAGPNPPDPRDAPRTAQQPRDEFQDEIPF